MFDEQPDGNPNGECAAEIHRLEAEITRLRAELAAANLYKPCRRKDTPHVPVKAIGPCDFAKLGIIESNEEFAARAGAQIQEVTE